MRAAAKGLKHVDVDGKVVDRFTANILYQDLRKIFDPVSESITCYLCKILLKAPAGSETLYTECPRCGRNLQEYRNGRQ
jgi:hypothetical protein